ncbi:MAG: hypothetical protein AB1306_12060 [Nitrospirota bacterium]
MSDRTRDKIVSIIGNSRLARSIDTSISSGLETSFFQLGPGKTICDVFKKSLDSAIRDIENHPRGQLFKRLLEFGPHNPDEPKILDCDGKTTLSDPECGSCVEFIFSHMVNRFKGELAELLAIEPCIGLIHNLQKEGHLPLSLLFYWGEIIKERRNITGTRKGEVSWGGFTKGADGLIVEKYYEPDRPRRRCDIKGVCEIKSMRQSHLKLANQIDRHILRLAGGLYLWREEYSPESININNKKVLRIIVFPSTWKLSRKWKSVTTDRGRIIVVDDSHDLPIQNKLEEIKPNFWKITLGWSQESIEQAAYEMTFWYMSQVGKSIYGTKPLPKGWEYMTPEEAGYNSIKEKLYYIPLRYISSRQERLAVKLYNVYCFSYPLGVDSKEMLWPQDFPDNDVPGKN